MTFSSELSSLLSSVSSVSDAESLYGKEEISLTVYLENENYPKIEIKLYRYDGEYCLAAVDGESVSLVKRSAVVDLIVNVYTVPSREMSSCVISAKSAHSTSG